MKLKLYTYLLGMLLLQMLFVPVAYATVTEKDIRVIARIIALLEQPHSGGKVKIGVMHKRANTQGAVDDFLALVGTSKTVGDITITAVPLRLEDVSTSDARVLFIPKGLDDSTLDKLFAVAKEQKLVTISTSEECLLKQRCAISITSEPAVDIKLSIAAAAATNVTFSPTFRMIIKEVQ